ncbi:SNF2_N-domain-containing protein [Fragilariopsis cylindrus CCMP1102]|uniref:SNF2_N-domain-containing protein n=1 Tax=Fragilariopsis cylindrus CCMP1102 TaxID=635003 RepID=A0A1E7FEN0_9STRA|nr:SNF2_N-domain-containing protein [Fragilariopsis cylindrus CCMP1102]|eukprot:OEU16596.1 SNF2_N-domain-containing protein [Fragilariopsis cylindrus CCMP1102]
MCKACPDVTLSKYQLIGVNWMRLLNGMTCETQKGTKNVNGVLADEMGLGKTVQTIAFLAWLKYLNRSLPHLIVVPVSTLPNWIREFEKFCPEMSVFKYHGSQKEREELKENLREHLPKNYNHKMSPQNQLDVIVAPVSYFQKENSPDRKFLSSFKYDYLVIDEAHNLKNAKSIRYKMLDKVKSEHRLLLTGTPVQNNPQELLNMLSFIMPLFSSAGKSFDDQDNYTEQMLKHFVDDNIENGDEQTAYKKLKQLFAPFVLRRKKDEVIAQLLPKKERKTVFVELCSGTRDIYQSIISDHLNKSDTKINHTLGENLFTNLRKCAHHPLLLRNRWKSGSEIEHLTNYFHKYDLFCSAKFESLRKLLPGLISDDHRILIFSSWTSCLDLLGCLMDYLKLKFQRMDGSTTSDDRQRLIDRFNTDRSYDVFLLSTKACGLGINLTSADVCILHDLDFNPFNDLQAEDRCHRIGQKRPVTVYKLIALNTVDEDIYKMQEKKAKMNAAIMDSSSSRKEKNDILKSVLKKAKCNGENDSDCEII